MAGIALRPMSIGEVLDRSFQLLRRHFRPLFLTALVGSAPLMGVYLLAGLPYGAAAGAGSELSAGAAILFLLGMVAGFALMSAAWAALVRQADQAIAGEQLAMGAALATGLRALPKLLIAALLVYLALFGLLLPVGLVFVVMAGVGAMIGNQVVATALVGVVVVAGGAVAFTVWGAIAFLILPALINEKLGPVKALRRANELSRGGRIRVVAVALISWLMVMLPTLGIPLVMGTGLAILWEPAAAGMVSTTQMFLYQMLSLAAAGVTTPFLALCMVLTHHDRRLRREGADLAVPTEASTQLV